jgi:hypothetical protein
VEALAGLVTGPLGPRPGNRSRGHSDGGEQRGLVLRRGVPLERAGLLLERSPHFGLGALERPNHRDVVSADQNPVQAHPAVRQPLEHSAQSWLELQCHERFIGTD